MGSLSKEDLKNILESKNIDEEALELLARQLERHMKDAQELAYEAAKLDGRSRIKKKDMQDVLRFRRFFQEEPE